MESTNDKDSDQKRKHVMISYCWNQQPVIKRIHAALISHRYSVWIDFEQ
eukprot:SAG31_NODE_48653_length_176_cov_10.441558_1_plen_48_part_01